MIIAIDYDDTYTADPRGWDAVIAYMSDRGHEFICVTGREETQPADINLPIIYAPSSYKKKAAEKAGYSVDVWIDDLPGFIEEGRVIEWRENDIQVLPNDRNNAPPSGGRVD